MEPYYVVVTDFYGLGSGPSHTRPYYGFYLFIEDSIGAINEDLVPTSEYGGCDYDIAIFQLDAETKDLNGELWIEELNRDNYGARIKGMITKAKQLDETIGHYANIPSNIRICTECIVFTLKSNCPKCNKDTDQTEEI
jgi:hypothetical protein